MLTGKAMNYGRLADVHTTYCYQIAEYSAHVQTVDKCLDKSYGVDLYTVLVAYRAAGSKNKTSICRQGKAKQCIHSL